MNQALIIYDEFGNIWNTTYGDVAMPSGLSAMIVDVPDGEQIMGVEIDENTKEARPILESMANNDYVKLLEQMETLNYTLQETNKTSRTLLAAACMSAESFTDEQALAVPELYMDWTMFPDGHEFTEGTRVRYGDTLYKVITGHHKQATWPPDTAHSLFAALGEPDAGTKDNPIIWQSGMESEKDKYYTDEGVLYIGMEDSGMGLFGQPKDLARYFEVVEE